MVSLDDAVIARLKKGEEHFEVLVDPYAAADLIDGKEVNVIQSLAIDAVFKDSKKGTHASEESLQKNFGTGDIGEISKQIILKGDIQLTTEQRHKMQKNKRNKIIETISRNAMDSKTKAPHPRQRIELAMEQAGVHIDPFDPEDIAWGIKEVLKTKDKGISWGKNGRKRAIDTFSWELVTQRTLEIYKEFIKMEVIQSHR